MGSAARAVSFKCSPYPTFRSKNHMYSPSKTLRGPAFPRSSSLPPPGEAHLAGTGSDAAISLQEWQAWGTTSPIPAMVAEVVEDLKVLERDADAQMSFGGIGGKLKGLSMMLTVLRDPPMQLHPKSIETG